MLFCVLRFALQYTIYIYIDRLLALVNVVRIYVRASVCLCISVVDVWRIFCILLWISFKVLLFRSKCGCIALWWQHYSNNSTIAWQSNCLKLRYNWDVNEDNISFSCPHTQQMWNWDRFYVICLWSNDRKWRHSMQVKEIFWSKKQILLTSLLSIILSLGS